jgi:lysophospholipid acyltransferase (LPLAT)-like uncharacterized protein
MTEAILENKSVPFSKKVKNWIVAQLGIFLFLSLMRSLRFSVKGLEHREKARKGHPKESHIIAIWHENAFCTVSGHRGQGLVPMISLSKDGEMISKVCVKIGYRPPVRGSSSRGGKSVKDAMMAALKDGATGAITVDGPRGPRREVKFGVVKIASDTGVAIVPSSAKISKMWVLRSWDRFRLPKPFAKVEVFYGPPLFVPPGLDKEGLKEYADKLRGSLNALEEGG